MGKPHVCLCKNILNYNLWKSCSRCRWCNFGWGGLSHYISTCATKGHYLEIVKEVRPSSGYVTFQRYMGILIFNTAIVPLYFFCWMVHSSWIGFRPESQPKARVAFRRELTKQTDLEEKFGISGNDCPGERFRSFFFLLPFNVRKIKAIETILWTFQRWLKRFIRGFFLLARPFPGSGLRWELGAVSDLAKWAFGVISTRWIPGIYSRFDFLLGLTGRLPSPRPASI